MVPERNVRSNGTRRSLTDREETSQWLGGTDVPTKVLEALFAGMSFGKSSAVIVHHPTVYDSCLEQGLHTMAMAQGLRVASFSYTTEPLLAAFATKSFVNFLREAFA
jgi:hypothetical protein